MCEIQWIKMHGETAKFTKICWFGAKMFHADTKTDGWTDRLDESNNCFSQFCASVYKSLLHLIGSSVLPYLIDEARSNKNQVHWTKYWTLLYGSILMNIAVNHLKNKILNMLISSALNLATYLFSSLKKWTFEGLHSPAQTFTWWR